MKLKLLTLCTLSSGVVLVSFLIQMSIIDMQVRGSPEYIRITGNLLYYDYLGIERPLVWARVWITDREPDGLDYLLAEVFSDVSGYFDSGLIVNNDGPGEDGYDISIYIVAWNWAVQVVDSNGYRYYAVVGPYNDLSDGTYQFTIRMPRGHGAWMIFSYHNGITAGWNYLYVQTGYQTPMVTCRWPFEDQPHYHVGGEIHLPGWAAGYPDVILHEYGHRVMYSCYGYIPPSMEEHSINLRSNSTTAWAEGWADFFPLVVQNDPDFAGENLETPTWFTANWDSGDNVEGRVAGALWDIFDSQSEFSDTYSDGFQHIWNVVSSQTDNTFREFWDAWYSQGYPKQPALMAIYQNTIDYRGPGDVNGDGVVDIVDGMYISRAFGSNKNWPWGRGEGQYNPEADLDHNGEVYTYDLWLWSTNYGRWYDC
jgi:hypothetical protein